MHVLIIGGTGTISRAITQSLLRRGHQVTHFNRGQRADPPPAEVRVLTGDRRERPAFEAAIQHETFDAAIDMISFNADDAASAMRALRGRVGHFVHCSTVMTYGPPFAALYQDETAPLNGRHDGGYGAGKVAADELLLRAFHDEQFPATVVKPSFTYGPGANLLHQADWSSAWIDRLRKGKPLVSVGDGTNYFQFMPAADAGEGFAMLLGQQAALGEVYNLVHPEPLTWDDWVRAAAGALGVEAQLVHVPADTLTAISPERYGHLRSNFAHTQVFSGAKLASLLPDWKATTPRAEAISQTIGWMEAHNHIANSDDDTLEDRVIAAISSLPSQVVPA